MGQIAYGDLVGAWGNGQPRARLGVLLLMTVTGWTAACSTSSDARPPQPTSPPQTTATSDVRPPLAWTMSPAPTLPPEADRDTPSGAVAFLTYFFDIYAHAFWSADPSRLEDISDQGCKFCSSAIATVQRVHSKREYVEGGRIKIIAAGVAPTTMRDRTVLAARITQEPGRTLSASGSVEASSSPVPSHRFTVAVRWVSNRWIVLGVADAPESSP